MTQERAFAQVDVFSAEPYRGNPVAVVLDAEGMSEEQMTAVARWTNLSETTFVLPPTVADADYKLRIFTPGGELPFAGHPTLGSAHAWLQNGGVPASPEGPVQECGAGFVQIRDTVDDAGTRLLAFAAPEKVRTGPLDDNLLDRIVRSFGISRQDVVDHQWVDNGPGWAAVELGDAERVLALDPDFAVMGDAKVGVVGMYPEESDAAYEVRAFAPGYGAPEDPVTGSLNASVAQWLIRSGRLRAPYRASQGAALGRSGRIEISVDDAGTVWVGGPTATMFRGTALVA